MANANPNNSKNWICRLQNLRIRRRSTNSTNRDDFTPVIYRCNLPSYRERFDGDNENNCSNNSLRKSLRKVHARVKNAFKHKSTNQNSESFAHSLSMPTSSTHSQSTVTLNSSNSQIENIYLLEPSKNTTESSMVDSAFPMSSGSSGVNEKPFYNLADSRSVDQLVIPPRHLPKRTFPQLFEIQNGRVPKIEVVSLSNCYWYWGPILRTQAEERLNGFPDGAFLIRDSSSDRHIFTMSFRIVGKTMHTRIELSKSGYSLFDQGGYHSIAELVEDALTKSRNGIYCYTKSRDEINPNYPVRLTLPVSRYDKVASLKYLSRFVIRQCININEIEKLPLPCSLLNYLQEDGQYF